MGLDTFAFFKGIVYVWSDAGQCAWCVHVSFDGSIIVWI